MTSLAIPNPTYKDPSTHCLEIYGNWAQYLLPIGVGVISLASPTYRGRALTLGLAAAIQQVCLDLVCKKHFPRIRPERKIANKVSKEDNQSFPSGHTAGAFLAVGYTAGILGFAHPCTFAMTALASVVGYSRYAAKRHWLSDVAAGAIMGLGFGLLGAKC